MLAFCALAIGGNNRNGGENDFSIILINYM